MGIIPLGIIVLYLILGGSDSPRFIDKTDRDTATTAAQTIPYYNASLSDREQDFSVIYEFIIANYISDNYEQSRLIAQNIVDSSHLYSIDPKLIAALIARESSFDPLAVSKTNARGLGQIKDFNYDSLGITNPFDIKQNVKATVAYLHDMLTQWPGHADPIAMALASYYQGYTATKKARRLNRKTKVYVRNILKTYKVLQKKRLALS